MALGFSEGNSGGSDRLDYIKYNAKAGRMYRIDRENSGSGWETFENEITNDFTAIMDLENIEVGWMHFPTGSAPSFALSRIGEPKAARPSPDHREGFRVVMKLSQASAGGKPAIRELTGNAAVVRRGMDELHNDYIAGVASNPGMLPVVKLEKVASITTENKHGKQTNYQPVFKIVKWVPRPDDLTFKPSVAAPAPSAASAPPSTGSRQAEPPKAKVLEDDFAEF
jgi:hypothetical protein